VRVEDVRDELLTRIAIAAAELNGLLAYEKSLRPEIEAKLKVNMGRDLLRTMLADGPVTMKAVIGAGIDMGLSTRTMIRAKEGLAGSRKIGSVWHWELKEE
jgi:hypothetical protein